MTCPTCATWRAHAEALAAILIDVLVAIDADHLVVFSRAAAVANRVRMAVSLLPAQALAERRALEDVAAASRYVVPYGFNVALGKALAALDAALGAARGEGGCSKPADCPCGRRACTGQDGCPCCGEMPRGGGA